MAQAKAKGETFRDTTKKRDVRQANIEAAKAVADAVRTSLGPRGMDKMVAAAGGEVIITNDGATILNKMTVTHPAAKMLVELAKSQDVVAGDGTTSVVVICGALLKKAQELLEKGIHPTVISDSFNLAANKACEILESVAIPVNLEDKESLVRAANTSLSSKVVSQHSSFMSPMAVESVLRVMDPQRPELLDLRDIRVVCKVGGTIDDSELVAGCVFDQKAAKTAGGPTRVEKAKIGLIQFHLSPPKADLENNVIISDYAQMDRVYKEERNHILGMVKKIKATGCNVLLIQKSILRDAVTDLSLHYLAKAKIMVIRDIEREDIEFISKTLGCLPIAHIDHMRPEKLGSADLVEEVECGKGKVVKVTGIANQGRTAKVLLRGSNKLVLEEAERSLHDALCVLSETVKEPRVLFGGGWPEMRMARAIDEAAKKTPGKKSLAMEAFARALRQLPTIICDNAGLDSADIVATLRAAHGADPESTRMGVDVIVGGAGDMSELGVFESFRVKQQVLISATEAAEMILRVDDIIKCAPRQRG